MLLLFRKIVFYILLVVYCFLTPYAILYALGYVVSPYELGIVKTGLLSVETQPSGASLFIDGKKYSRKTPAVVSDLVPGEYTAKLTLKDYWPWERKISIRPEKAAQLEPLVLLPVRPKHLTISQKPYDGFIPSVLEFRFWVWEKKSSLELSTIDIFFKREVPLNQAGLPAISPKSEILTKPGSSIALFLDKTASPLKVWLLNTNDEKDTVKLLSEIPPDAILFDWDPENSQRIFYISGKHLFGFEHKKSLVVDLKKGVKGFGAGEGHLVILTEDNQLLEMNFKGQNEQPLEVGDQFFSLPQLRENHWRIKILGRNLVALLSPTGCLLTNQAPYLHVPNSVVGVQPFSSWSENKLMWWTSENIGVIDFDDSLFAGSVTSQKLYSKGKQIKEAVWAYDDSYIVLMDENNIQLLDTRFIGKQQAQMLERTAKDSPFYYSEREKAVYFLEAGSSHLVKRKLTE